MKKNFFVLAATIIGSQLQAQQDTLVLDEVIFTATKMEQKQSHTGKVVTIITKKQLEKSAGKSLAQVLNEQAGLIIAGAYNAPGSVQTVFMRGASSGRTLILVDGVPVNDPSMINQEYDLNYISLSDVERIEICRGAMSTLYGSDAIGGVINIITAKKNIKAPVQVEASGGFGNLNTARNHVQVSGKIRNRLAYITRYSKLSTDGFSAAHDPNHTGTFDKDGYDGNTAGALVQYQIIPSLSLRTFIHHSRYRAAIDAGVFRDDKDFTLRNHEWSGGGGFDFKKGKVSFAGHYRYGHIKRNYLDDSLHAPGFVKFASDRYNAISHVADVYGNIRIKDWLTVLAGTDFRRGTMNQQYVSVSSFGPFSSTFENKSLHQVSLYGSLFFHAAAHKLNIEAGGRINEHSRYGLNSTFTFNPSCKINDRWRVFGSLASGFKAPSVFQVYDAFSGNEDLKPETSLHYEAGVQQLHEVFSSRVVFFHRDIKNGIDFDYVNFKYFNFVKQKVNGAELEMTVRPATSWQMTAHYTFLSGEEHTQSRKNFSDTTYRHLLRRPKHHLNLNAGVQLTPAIYLSLGGKSVGKRYDTGGYMSDDVLLGSYFLLNAYAEYRPGKHIKFYAAAQNITGKKFFDIRGYNAIPFLISGGFILNR
jgi:vitamin B12 transporter